MQRNIVRNINIICAFSLLFLLASFTDLSRRAYTVDKIVIDAGHGGKDTGTLGKYSKEKTIALSIALKLGKIIKENLKDVEIIYTRDSDVFIPLDTRADHANKNSADLFVSIHANSEPGHNAQGTETWVMGLHTSDRNLEVAKKENSVILMEEDYQEKYEGFDPNSPESYILFSLYQNAYLGNSLNLAEKIEDQFKNRVRRYSRGVKQAGFIVLWKTAMPSVLIEVGFLSHNKEEHYLNDELGQTYLASGIFRAIRDYKEELETNN
jgi:N-acetylmuramoyl-L-alanine amidase